MDIPYLLWPVLAVLFCTDATIVATLAVNTSVGWAIIVMAAVMAPLAIISWVILDKRGEDGLTKVNVITK